MLDKYLLPAAAISLFLIELPAAQLVALALSHSRVKGSSGKTCIALWRLATKPRLGKGTTAAVYIALAFDAGIGFTIILQVVYQVKDNGRVLRVKKGQKDLL